MTRKRIGRALRISMSYMLTSVLWILVTDQVASRWVDVEALTRVQTAKGWLFVMLSTALIHVLASRELRSSAREQAAMRRMVALSDAHRERMEMLSRRLLAVDEEQRKRLARELHDQLGQTLTLLSLHLQRAQRVDDDEQPLAEALELADETLEQVRSLSLQLRPPMLDDLGLLPALAWLLNRYERLFATKLVVPPELTEEEVPEHLRMPCYRIVQEAVSNAARHGEPEWVEVELGLRGDQLELVVRDDGRGFDVEGQAAEKMQERGLGLISMTERVRLCGGDCAIESERGVGTTIRATFDLDAAPTPMG